LSGQISYATPWIGTNNSTDYFNACASVVAGTSVPYPSGGGYLPAKTGNAYAGLWGLNGFTTDYREYLQVQLNNTLVGSQCYFVRYYLNLADQSRWAINNMAAHFSILGFTTSGSPALLTPQIFKYGNPIISDTINWVEVDGIYSATGGEKFITLGNFKGDSNTDTLIINNSGYYGSYYFIDDVSVVPIDSIIGGMPAFAGNDTSVVSGDSVFIGQQITGLNCNWYNASGGLIASNTSGVFVHPTSTTHYVIEQNLCGSITYDTVNVNVTHVGIEEISFIDKLKIFPNPSEGEINILFDDDRIKDFVIEVVDIAGKSISKKQINLNRGINKIYLDIENGFYFINIFDKGNNERIVKKIIIQK
jgi:hypothetical protein